MRYMLWLLVPALLLGCSGGAYKISKDEYRERVRTLGVLPLMVDPASTVTHPERQQVIDLLQRHNDGKHEELIARLRGQKGYFDVRAIDGDPRHLFQRLVRGSSLRGKGADLYRRYHFDGAAAAEMAATHVVDGLLVMVMNGVERTESRRDRGPLLSYLEAPYNPVLVTAAVVLPSGEIAWEYSPEPGENFLNLQYPAFDEAFYNKTDEVRIKYITLDGLERTLAEPERKLFGSKAVPQVYSDLFERLASALHPGLLNPLRSKETDAAPAHPRQ